jgi:hypothetical protein
MSPSGYKTNFSDTIDEPGYFTYILKGEASCSGFIEKIAKTKEILDQEVYYCAVDPESIDAVVFPEERVIVCDSIVPHLFEPRIAGVTGQIVNLSESWDTEKLCAESEMLEELSATLESGADRAERCIKALASVVYDNFDLAKRTLLLEKLDGFFGRLCKKLLPKRSENHESDTSRGKILYRYYSALTSEGFKTLIPHTGTVYILNDDYSAGANYLLSRLQNEAASRGFDVIVSMNALMPSEHGAVIGAMSIPELQLFFFTSTSYACLPAPEKKQIINFMRFYTKSLLSNKKQRMRFNCEAAESLLAEAVSALESVREIKRSMERYYEKVIDDKVTEDIEQKIIKKL